MAGRPEFIPTAAMREDVEIMKAARISEADISKRLGVDKKTLRKHFAKELDSGYVKRNTEFYILRYRAAVKADAKTSDANLWLQIISRIDPDTVATEDQSSSLTASPLGKKEQRIAAAATAGDGTDWAELIKPTPPVSH